MILGVPTLNRYDLLIKLLDSAYAGDLKPSRVWIIDNGGGLAVPKRFDHADVITPGVNIGVAASWNLLLKLAESERLVIANDDIVLGRDTLAKMNEELGHGADFVECNDHGWSLFAQSPRCTERVGYYDERFYPAYFEDNDYSRRMRLANIERTAILNLTGIEHYGSATKELLPSLNVSQSRLHYLTKWGGLPGHERYQQPFAASNFPKRSIAVAVQAGRYPGRKGWEEVKASIEASDIGTDYQVHFHPAGISVHEHFIAVLDALYATHAELCLRLEDDVEVNYHILHNISNWIELQAPQFGIGWLFDPGGSAYPRHLRVRHRVPTATRWVTTPIAYSQAVVMRRSDIPEIRARCIEWFKGIPEWRCGQDIALSTAVLEMGKKIAIHAPALVEHRLDLPSLLAHAHNKTGSSNGAFFKLWRRGEPEYDQHGRVLR